MVVVIVVVMMSLLLLLLLLVFCGGGGGGGEGSGEVEGGITLTGYINSKSRARCVAIDIIISSKCTIT